MAVDNDLSVSVEVMMGGVGASRASGRPMHDGCVRGDEQWTRRV